MARPSIPPALTAGPFTFDDAQRAGLTRKQLRGLSWRRIAYGQYVWAGLSDHPELTLAAVFRRLPPGAAFSGRTAAWLHGLDLAPCDPVEATIPTASGMASLAGVSLRRASLPDSELVIQHGFTTTSSVRTVFDLGSQLPLVEAVVVVDMALRGGLVRLPQLHRCALEHQRAKGIPQFRRVVAAAEPLAESPMESRLRMLLVLSGLPRPEAQVSLHDGKGRFLARVDLYYPAHRLAIEYDGGTHRTSLVEDNRRQNRLLNAGYRLLRFTVADIRESPAEVGDQVKRALASMRGEASRPKTM